MFVLQINSPHALPDRERHAAVVLHSVCGHASAHTTCTTLRRTTCRIIYDPLLLAPIIYDLILLAWLHTVTYYLSNSIRSRTIYLVTYARILPFFAHIISGYFLLYLYIIIQIWFLREIYLTYDIIRLGYRQVSTLWMQSRISKVILDNNNENSWNCFSNYQITYWFTQDSLASKSYCTL